MSTTEAGRLGPLAGAARVRALPVALAALTVVQQIAYPLVPAGVARDRVTVTIVVTFAAAMLAHAAVWRGPRFAARLVAVTIGGGLAVELVGVSTGVPFGGYTYLGSLGPAVGGVPLVIGLAWMMMAYPAVAVATALGGPWWRRTLVGGWALAAWDLFLDPQMVQAGHWRWEDAAVTVNGIPLSNHLGWLLVATAMLALLVGPATATPGVDDRVPLAMYVWTWASSVLALAAFFGLPLPALAGGIGMGVVVAALWASWRAPA